MQLIDSERIENKVKPEPGAKVSWDWFFTYVLLIFILASGAQSIPKQSQQELSSLESKYGRLTNIGWNRYTGVMQSGLGAGALLAKHLPASSQEVRKLSRTFITEFPALFGLKNDDLMDGEIYKSGTDWFVHFLQNYHNLKVEGGRVRLMLKEFDGKLAISSVNSDAIPGIDLPWSPTVTQEAAVGVARKAISANTGSDTSQKTVLMVLPMLEQDKLVPYLVWEVVFKRPWTRSAGVRAPDKPPTPNVIYVNALTGEVLKKFSNVVF